MVKQIDTKDDFEKCLKENAKVAVDFTATWCGPCKLIGPKFEELEGTYADIKFIKVDVDVNSEVSEARGIKAMPTFHFYLNGEKVDELVGASEAKLKEKLDVLKNK